MKRKSMLAFDATLDAHGRIVVPAHVAAALGTDTAALVRVQLTPAALADELRRNGVTEEEVGRIADLQGEPREQVITFLLAEGRLAGKSARGGNAKGRRR
jgi:bifunctional DNA-binding transcriptional regulator/antitoxin component of YhaV-PrlF toxin-antitoxin module